MSLMRWYRKPKKLVEIPKRTNGCLHDACPECKGKGTKEKDGTPCVHWVYCGCRKCSPQW